MSELSEKGKIELSAALESKAKAWLEQAQEDEMAVLAIRRELQNGHFFVRPPLTPEQITQRKTILTLALTMMEQAKVRDFNGFMHAIRALNEATPKMLKAEIEGIR